MLWLTRQPWKCSLACKVPQMKCTVYSLGTRELRAAKPFKIRGLEPRNPEYWNEQAVENRLKTKETTGKPRKTLENIKVSRVYPGGPPGFTQESFKFSWVFLGFPVISLVFSLFSRLFQPTTLTIYAFFDGESDFQVKNSQIQRPEAKI